MSTLETVKRIVIERLAVPEGRVTAGARFEDDLGTDSLDVIELVMVFEEQFAIEIDDDDLEKVKTISDAVTLIDKLRAENP